MKTFLKNYLYRLNHGTSPRLVERDPVTIPQHTTKNIHVSVNILLFVVTFVTMSITGAAKEDSLTVLLITGFPYAVTLSTILLAHEFGHYLAARKWGIKATLPFFIPYPFPSPPFSIPSPIGTFGAVIKIKSAIHHRRALLHIGAIGPLAGFIPSVAALVYGIFTSRIVQLPAPDPEAPLLIFGDSLLVSLVIRAIHGHIPPGFDIFFNQYAHAGCIGLFITSLNLLPLGQLDGGHILYALFGKNQRYVGWAAMLILAIMTFWWPWWCVWIVLTLAVLMVAHPYIPPGNEPLTPADILLGWACILILVLSFVPKPIYFL